MATIEPRLMHLLNDPKAPGLPPIQSAPYSTSSTNTLSLPPIETDPSIHWGEEKTASRQIHPLYNSEHNAPNPGRTKSTRHTLQLLLDESDSNIPPSSSLRMILDDTTDLLEDPSNKKRHRAMTVKDDFFQLPQPLKKQKSTQQVVPPIINGLHEPPPDAAVFPPIASGSFDDADAPNLNALKEFTNVTDDRPAPGAVNTEAEKAAATTEKVKRKAAKPRRKWTEEETNHLLLGVSRHGVGKWTSILEDPEFKFNSRTAGDLKDRFRTCCPAELRGQAGNKNTTTETSTATEPIPEPRLKTKKGLPLENILIDADEPLGKEDDPAAQPDTELVPKPRKSRAHRKKMEDLVELGIRGPFKKSHRRERRPFTEQDDREILDGLDKYGPAWSKIQRDPRFNLSSRQPTDLRDRVRNKYPKVYSRIDKGSLQINDGSGKGDLLEPSINTTISNSLNPSVPNPLEPNLSRSGSGEDLRKWPLSSSFGESTETLATNSALDLSEPTASVFMTSTGEMDISRLLLDDPRAPSDNTKMGGPDTSPNAATPFGSAPDSSASNSDHHIGPSASRRLLF